MIVSWKWLNDYGPFTVDPAQVVDRLAMAGLNHEGTEAVDDDLAIDIEVTSNRGDCLGHVGIAREIAVLFGVDLVQSDPRPRTIQPHVSSITRLTVNCPDLCPRYTARVIRGAKVGPSPAWLTARLRTLGIKPVNNVVDITNYVLFECGQPLHAFDFNKLRGKQIIVREARAGEQITAIDHKAYALTPGMCVIADAERPVALGGIMGGYDTEVTEGTTELLIESAQFQPLAIRNAARRLKLHSPSSYRFERGVDPVGVEWASRRCCQLILELAGGELYEGVADSYTGRAKKTKIRLRYAQLRRVLGIEIAEADVRRILTALGCDVLGSNQESLELEAPTWRRDLTREIDLIEEVARIYGYDKIPENVAVPMFASHRTDADRVLGRVRAVLTAAGCDEALTTSAIPEPWSDAFSPWTDAPPLRLSTPILKGADCLRRSLVPSLLAARATNEALGNPIIELFETAKIYLPRANALPHEAWSVAIVHGGDYLHVKGLVESLLDYLQCTATLEVTGYQCSLFAGERGSCLRLGGELFGYLGEVSNEGAKLFGLKGNATVAELSIEALLHHAKLVPQHTPLVPYPSITQDLNVIVDESVRWAEMASTIRQGAGELLESLTYRETYRDPKTDGPGKKRILFSITLRSPDGTLTTEQANQVRTDVLNVIGEKLKGWALGSTLS